MFSFLTNRIGLAIAKRLGQDGAKVMISSRKKEHVEGTVENLRKQNLDVAGTICHVGKSKDRESLVQEVYTENRRQNLQKLPCL